MISQSLFKLLRDLATPRGKEEFDTSSNLDVEFQSFLRPYVLVIHQPSGRGFYLDLEYRHIIDVDRCQEPENPVETERYHLCPSTNLPAWVEFEIRGRSVIRALKCSEFDSFWLY